MGKKKLNIVSYFTGRQCPEKLETMWKHSEPLINNWSANYFECIDGHLWYIRVCGILCADIDSVLRKYPSGTILVQLKKSEIGLRNILTLNQLEWAQGGFKGLFGFERIQIDLDNQIYRTCEVQYMNPLKMKIDVVFNQAPLPLISPVGRASKSGVWGTLAEGIPGPNVGLDTISLDGQIGYPPPPSHQDQAFCCVVLLGLVTVTESLVYRN